MCVIIVKPAGVKVPEISVISAAMAANPDGFGLAISDGKRLKIYHSMDKGQMLKIYASKVSENSAAVFHARIATAGSVSVKNCHGFPVRGLGEACAFFHNGVLSINAREDMTDSETFLHDIYEPAAALGEVYGERAINAVIGSSKFAFIHASGRIRTYGHFHEVNGVQFSNLYFCTQKSYKPEPRRFGWERYAYLY